MNLVNHSSQSSAARAVGGALFAALVLFALAARSHLATGANSERPGDLGFLAVELPARLPEGFDPKRTGALVSWVLTGGPADHADVREGDIVLQFDNQPISGPADLFGRMRRLGAGRLASMVIWRDGKEINTGLMTLAERGRYPGEIVGSRGGPGGAGAGAGSGEPGGVPSDRESRAEMRITELEREIVDLDRDLTALRSRVERLEATDRSMIGR